MRSWTVHAPPDPLARPAILLREGFSWGAFLLGLPWLLWHRLWLEAAIWLGLALVLGGLAVDSLVPPGLLPPVAVALQFLLGAQAQDLRRAALARRGWRLVHVVAAPDQDRAIARLMEAEPALAPALVRAALA